MKKKQNQTKPEALTNIYKRHANDHYSRNLKLVTLHQALCFNWKISLQHDRLNFKIILETYTNRAVPIHLICTISNANMKYLL